MPFGGRCGAARAAGTAATAGGGAMGCVSASPASANSSSTGSAGTDSPGTTGMDPFTAAGAKAWATACSRPRPPRPRPPRRRRPRPVDPEAVTDGGVVAGCAPEGFSWDGCPWEVERVLRTGRGSGTGGDGAEASDSLFVASGAGLGCSSALKYAGCKGGGAAWSEGSAGVFLRRCKRSRIHLRMQGF